MAIDPKILVVLALAAARAQAQQAQRMPQGRSPVAQRPRAKFKQSPAAQGHRGASGAHKNPNMGGYNSNGPAEMTNPGMSAFAQILGALLAPRK